MRKDMNNQLNNTKIVTKISVPDTLLAIGIGETVMIPSNKIKTGSIRVAATRLEKRKQARFFVTEEGLVNETQITRLK
jgi:hypothetical protein